MSVDYMGPKSLDPACQPDTTTKHYVCGGCGWSWNTEEHDVDQCPECGDPDPNEADLALEAANDFFDPPDDVIDEALAFGGRDIP